MTPEREKFIRALLDCNGGLIEPVASEVFAELDRVRGEKAYWETAFKNRDELVDTVIQQRDNNEALAKIRGKK